VSNLPSIGIDTCYVIAYLPSYVMPTEPDITPETEHVFELAACEASRLVLRAGALYRFHIHPGCELCQAAARPVDQYHT
jgi:hypothetical protein